MKPNGMAKIAGIKMGGAYNVPVRHMVSCWYPTNLYGLNEEGGMMLHIVKKIKKCKNFNFVHFFGGSDENYM
jgi:hypothetical protein